ncbi:MAG TPA: radical SAM protein, partial [bacterium]|nr:radical SAM protein [bacterium]
MLPLSSLLPEELTEQLQLKPPYRGRQVFRWLHQSLVFDFDGMSDLPEILRKQLKARAQLVGLRVEETRTDRDVKVVLRTRDDNLVEAVRLGDRSGRQTACLSTQAGCGMGCSFCRTAQMGLRRNLRADEIVDQFLIIQALGKPVSNVVFMGMGEPLCNLDNLNRAVRVMCHEGAFSFRRITLSTCGLIE